jgi:biotin carboxylase
MIGQQAMSRGAGDDTLPLVILLGSGYHLYREYLLEAVSRACRVWLFLHQEPTWERPYVTGHTVVDTLDSDSIIAAGKELSETMDVHGALCWDEVRMVQHADLVAALGLPGSPPDAVQRCRDKHLTRMALERAGVPQARSLKVATRDQAQAAAERIGYPVVIKPRALGASIGVALVSSPHELDEGFAQAREATEDGVGYFEEGVLVEEYMEGPEISVDSAILTGRVHALFLARKQLGFGSLFEEVGHVVDASDPLLEDPVILRVLNDAHAAVGFDCGMTHTELRLTRDGPKIVEINARLGGDLIPYIGMLASGIDAGAVAAALACGRFPHTTPSRRDVGAIRFFYPEEDTTVVSISLDALPATASIDRVRLLASPGQHLVLPPRARVAGRYAYATAVAADEAACNRALDAAAAALHLVGAS